MVNGVSRSRTVSWPGSEGRVAFPYRSSRTTMHSVGVYCHPTLDDGQVVAARMRDYYY